LTWGLLAACAILLWPLIPAVVLAVWLANLARPIQRRLARKLGGRPKIAAGISVLLLVLVLVPFVTVFISLAADAYSFVNELMHSPRGKEVLEDLASHGAPAKPSASGAWDFLLSQKEHAWSLLQQVAGTATRVIIEAFVTIAGTYAVLVEGDGWYTWMEQHAPISPAMLGRLRDAFDCTGRGLFIGIGGSGLIQGIVATIVYLALSIPRGVELGVLTFVASFVPGIGSGLVWGPLAIGLALSNRMVAAVILVICGVGVIGAVDNIARPWLARRGNLGLPTYVVLVTMFAGVITLGPWGLLIAPLVVRLTKAALEAEP
jgi:predicted PurR-regulated permease PerM